MLSRENHNAFGITLACVNSLAKLALSTAPKAASAVQEGFVAEHPARLQLQNASVTMY